MRALFAVLALLLVSPMVARAQIRPEFRPFVGALIPTGNQRDVLQDAVLTGVQAGVEAGNRMHIIGTFAFAGPNFDKQIPMAGHMHVYQSDVGAELFADRPLDNGWRLRPFLGLGGGVRTYDLTDVKGSKSYAAGYGAVGSEFQLARIAFRLEARDYLTRFRGPTGNGDATTRNEVAISAGLAYHLR